MRAMGVCQDDVLDVRRRAADAIQFVQHEPGVGTVQRINQGQTSAVVNEVRMNQHPLPLHHAVNAGRSLHAAILLSHPFAAAT